MQTDREHRLRDNLGQTFLYTRWPQYEEDRQLRDEAVICHKVFVQQHLQTIAESDHDPFHYGLLDLWLNVYHEPWAKPRTLAKLVDDLAEKIASGELRVYLEDSLMWRHVSSGGSNGASVPGVVTHGAEEAEGADEARSQKMPVQGAAAAPVSTNIRPVSEYAHHQAAVGGPSKIVGDLEKYESRPMKSRYDNEDNPDSLMRWNKPQVVTYLSEAEKQELELDVKDNLVVVRDTGQPFGTADAPMGAIFIMEPSGRILASNYESSHEFHHSSLSSGKPVASAGKIHVAEGHLLEINNYSGHYEPDQKANNQVFAELEDRGLLSKNIGEVMQGGWKADGISTEFKPHKEFTAG